MLRWLRQNAEITRIGQDLYALIVAQARAESLYRTCGIPDTMDGRFEAIVLHLVMVLRRLKREGRPAQRLGQRLMETFVADLDDALRQIGVGDMGVPRRVGRAAAALKERAQAYEAALDAPGTAGQADPDPLVAALRVHLLGQAAGSARAADPGAAARLAAYVRAVDRHLASQPRGAVLEGRITFPPAPDRGDRQ